MFPAVISYVQFLQPWECCKSYSYCNFYPWFSLQAKADEIAKLMNENEQFKALIEDLKVYLFFQCIVFRIMFCFNIQFIYTINWYQKKEFPLTLSALYSNVRQRKWITRLREFQSPSSLSLHSWHTFCYLSINYIYS
jgi:hypothetical protein